MSHHDAQHLKAVDVARELLYKGICVCMTVVAANCQIHLPIRGDLMQRIDTLDMTQQVSGIVMFARPGTACLSHMPSECTEYVPVAQRPLPLSKFGETADDSVAGGAPFQVSCLAVAAEQSRVPKAQQARNLSPR